MASGHRVTISDSETFYLVAPNESGSKFENGPRGDYDDDAEDNLPLTHILDVPENNNDVELDNDKAVDEEIPEFIFDPSTIKWTQKKVTEYSSAPHPFSVVNPGPTTTLLRTSRKLISSNRYLMRLL